MSANYASRHWAFSAGYIPSAATGLEPDFTSRDEICLLNPGAKDACAEITVLHTDQEPVGPYRIEVAARRVKHVRINDLIDPAAVPLDVAYGLTLESDQPVVVQLRHLDSRQEALAVSVTGALPG
ncbi:sensory rhodopsin transducer [Bogoriella caseilytica]|uniref:Sensory rhodopsin transducer n=1 Tax=Bogoriella caseilytica TaxID=56055 RepID=A0A3N2BBF9_9MICO|nr:sensory rhodopsin transducer [Bogoriella caseilytica]ROR72596.1 hypothetical protein EDD31_0951 [Bogoriella caseilytica]